MTTLLIEEIHTGEFLLSHDGAYSREQITVASGQDLPAGQVYGLVTKALAAAPIPSIVGTGTGLMSALTFGPLVETGPYVVELLATGATAAFSVTSPSGESLPNGAVGTAYRSGHLSFLISNGGTMTAGDTYTVAVTAGGTPTVIGGTGTGTLSAIGLGPDAMNGGYIVKCVAAQANGGDFDVLAPDGKSIGRFPMGTGSGGSASFASRHVNFTLTDATDFIAGDYFNLIVAKGSRKAKALAPTATDGTQHPAGILYAATDAGGGDTLAVGIVREAEVVGSLLTGFTESIRAELAALPIIVR